MHLLSDLEQIVRIFWFSLYSQVPSGMKPLFLIFLTRNLSSFKKIQRTQTKKLGLFDDLYTNEKKIRRICFSLLFIMYYNPSSSFHKPTNKRDDLQYRNIENLYTTGSNYLESTPCYSKVNIKANRYRHSSNQMIQNVAVLTHFCTGKPMH